jgi:hypothetical protein
MGEINNARTLITNDETHRKTSDDGPSCATEQQVKKIIIHDVVLDFPCCSATLN